MVESYVVLAELLSLLCLPRNISDLVDKRKLVNNHIPYLLTTITVVPGYSYFTKVGNVYEHIVASFRPYAPYAKCDVVVASLRHGAQYEGICTELLIMFFLYSHVDVDYLCSTYLNILRTFCIR